MPKWYSFTKYDAYPIGDEMCRGVTHFFNSYTQ